MTDAKLNEYNRDEWREIAQLLRPDWTEEEFEAAWSEFLELKARKETQ